MNSAKALFSNKLIATSVALATAIALLVINPVFAQQVVEEQMGSVTDPLGDAYAAPKTIAPEVGRITVYRQANGTVAGVGSIQINDHYHVSLQQGSYSELCLPPGRISLASRMVRTGSALKNYNDATTAITLNAGENVFVRLGEYGNNRTTIRAVPAEVALSELSNTQRQIHAISRVPNALNCLPVEKPVVKPAVNKENIVIAADALFPFGKSDMAGISPKGRDALDELVAHLQKEYGNQENTQIQIVGHADPLGNPASNKRLSEERAQSIRSYMIQGGMKAERITAEGMGATQLIAKSCGKTATPKTIACNKPNRRVVIGVQVNAR